MKSGGISLFGEDDICNTDWKDQMWTEAVEASYQMSYGPQQGWQCPLCGTVYAPFVTCCTCGKRHTITTTASTTPSGKDPRGDKK